MKSDGSINEHEIVSALKGVGMEAEMTEQFVESFRLGQKDKVKQILLSYRAKLLSDVHERQDKLYCVDFLIRELITNQS